jgi:hypothetical protein
MKLGSLSQQDAGEILQRARDNQPLARLRSEGPAHLFELAQKAGEWTAQASFVDSCDLHTHLLSRASGALHGLLISQAQIAGA